MFLFIRSLELKLLQQISYWGLDKKYAFLRDYIMELQARNEETTVKVKLEYEPNLGNITSRKFKRIYNCLGSPEKDFKQCLRDFIGLDGAL